MEEREVFTFRNRALLGWLGLVALLASAAAAAAPPALWLCVVGALFLVVGLLCNSLRTGQWNTWDQWAPELSWFEGWAASTGGILMAIPMIGMVVRIHAG